MKWKLLIALFLVANINLFAHHNDEKDASIFDQLVQLNKQWSNKNNDFPNLQTPKKFSKHTDLISLHLDLVETELRENPPKNLTEKQLANREQGLDILKTYQQAGKFPINNHHTYTLPYFIDDFNTACAVGHIIRESGSVDLAHKIAKEANYAFIEDMNFPELPIWASDMGFTVEELKWIQPTYSPAVGIILENSTNPDCNQSNGTLNILVSYLTVSEENTSVSFSWIEGKDFNNATVISTQEDLTNVSAGFYCVRVDVESTDFIMSPSPYTFCYELSNASGPNITSTITNQNCQNLEDGEISLEIEGDTPYSIEWYNFQGELIASDVETVSNLAGNSPFVINFGGPIPTYNYYVIVTDEAGCKAVETFLVSVNSEGPYISSFGNEVTNATCSEGGSISLGFHSGDLLWYPPPYPPTFGPQSPQRDGLAPGTYRVVATDDFGCQTEQTFEVGFDDCTDATPVSVCSGSSFIYNWGEFGDEQSVFLHQNATNGTVNLQHFYTQSGSASAKFTYTPDPGFIGTDTVVIVDADYLETYYGAIQWIFNVEECGDVCLVEDPLALPWLQEIIDNSNGCSPNQISHFQVDGSSYFASIPHPGGFIGAIACPADIPLQYYDCNGNVLCSVGNSPFPPDCPDGILGGQANGEIIWTFEQNPNDCICTQEYAPVCGTDGITYGNACAAACAGVEITFDRECDCFCVQEYAPVCSTDGVTYSNACIATCAGVQIAFNGECGNNNICLLDANVYLQGAYANSPDDLMRDDLRVKEVIPLIEPFTTLPDFEHAGDGGGETVDENVLKITGNNAIIDWVLIELHDGSTNNLRATSSALLQRDGDIVDTDGVSSVKFNVPDGDYRVTVRHRNHLGVTTKDALTFEAGATPINADFNTIETYGEAALMEMNDKKVMWGGCAADGQIIFQGPGNVPNIIFFDVLSAPENTTSAPNFIHTGDYNNTDLDMSGETIFQGVNNDVNFAFFTILNHPGNVNLQPNYIIKEQKP